MMCDSEKSAELKQQRPPGFFATNSDWYFFSYIVLAELLHALTD